MDEPDREKLLMKFETNRLNIVPVPGACVLTAYFSPQSDFQAFMDKHSDTKLYAVEIKEKKEQRSLDANAYAWVLCRKIGQSMTPPAKAEDIYQQAIRDYGVTQIYPVRDDDVDSVIRMFNGMGLGNSCDSLGASKIDGYTNVRFYYGSSNYDTAQMSKLIDGLVADAHDLGISTMTPSEIEKLKSLWS